ncbi:Obscurin [Varanus komodoensis]|nr:Obscurin [Varanus komodoensis]
MTCCLSLLYPSAVPARFQEELKSKEVKEGEIATLRCVLSKVAQVEWKKGQTALQPSEKYKIKQKDNVAELTIQNVTEQDAGDYVCVCGDQKTSASLTVHALPPRFKVELKNLEAAEGERAALRCELTRVAAPVTWRKGNQVLKPSDKYDMKQEGPVAELVIHSLELADAGAYSCAFGEAKTSASLAVNALPARFEKGLENREASEGGSATLRCELTKAAVVEWKKKHKALKPSDKYRMRQDGPVSELVILDLELSDAGEYSCVCGHEKTTAALTVHGKSVCPVLHVWKTPVFLFHVSTSESPFWDAHGLLATYPLVLEQCCSESFRGTYSSGKDGSESFHEKIHDEREAFLKKYLFHLHPARPPIAVEASAARSTLLCHLGTAIKPQSPSQCQL